MKNKKNNSLISFLETLDYLKDTIIIMPNEVGLFVKGKDKKSSKALKHYKFLKKSGFNGIKHYLPDELQSLRFSTKICKNGVQINTEQPYLLSSYLGLILDSKFIKRVFNIPV